MRITPFVLGPYATNCFVLEPDEAAARCWVIDCGFQPEPMLDHIADAGLAVQGVLLTHCHSDHIAGLDLLRARVGEVPVSVHRAEVGFCADALLNLSAMAGAPVTVGEPDVVLEGDEVLDIDGTAWRVVHSPGHSPGGVLYVCDAAGEAFVGDTIFAGSIGRHDFPTSNVDDLRRSVQDVVMGLPDEMNLYPGHGPITTVGRERRSNPFVVAGF